METPGQCIADFEEINPGWVLASLQNTCEEKFLKIS